MKGLWGEAGLVVDIPRADVGHACDSGVGYSGEGDRISAEAATGNGQQNKSCRHDQRTYAGHSHVMVSILVFVVIGFP